MPKQSSLPTIAEAVERALAEVQAPTSLDVLLRRILTIRPSEANNPTGSIRTHIRELEGRSVVYLDSKTVSPLRVAAVGARFRVPLSGPEVADGALAISPGFDGWVNHFDEKQNLEFISDRHKVLPTRVVTIQGHVNIFPLGDHEIQRQAFDLADWFLNIHAHENDTILLKLCTDESGRFTDSSDSHRLSQSKQQ
ncbi:hypothetical protein IH992_13675 [Candidatus Poribacteria bacterium]|nr:hypothetical protein [Candidatus Poribacteria bacterium]